MLSWLIANRADAAKAHRADARIAAESAVQTVDQRVESLELACAGMWELLKFKLGCTDDELVAAVQAVDARDGRIDGKITPQSDQVCPNCHRKLLTKTGPRCSWCGAALTRIPF